MFGEAFEIFFLGVLCVTEYILSIGLWLLLYDFWLALAGDLEDLLGKEALE